MPAPRRSGAGLVLVACLVMTCAKDPPPREALGDRAAPRAAAAARDESGPPAVAPASAAAARGPGNLQVLPRSMSKRALKQRMRQMSKALGVQCSFCHVRGDMAADTPHKDTARQMMRMVEAINTEHLKRRGARITCDTCHRGRKRPAH